MRDDFIKRTIEIIAKRAGYLCSNPACRRSTIGAARGHDGVVNIGVAAHITAAAPGGPRYDPSLSREQRRHQSNGIWACQSHGKLIDSDPEQFSVATLREWRQRAEDQSFRAILELQQAHGDQLAPLAADTEETGLLARLGLAAEGDLESIALRVAGAAQADLAAFQQTARWPQHLISLNLRIADGHDAGAFDVAALAATVETFNELVVVAPPGTGKTVTLLQLVGAILSRTKAAAVFVPLSEWSSQADSFFPSIVRRHAYAGFRKEHLELLAHQGRLVLVLDGWNELDATSRTRARHSLEALQRDFPALGVVISTRRQVLDVPISGRVVEIDGLTEDQQLELARAQRGSRGEAILDHVWRTPGVRDLITIPLYLRALLVYAPDDALPTTREAILRMFVGEHKRMADRAETLRAILLGFHKEMLVALAVVATRAANITISESQARVAVKRATDQLIEGGQITSAPQPTTVLDALVSHHLLVRSGAEIGAFSFQHQQFQEWYASFEVEALMSAIVAGDPNAKRKLKTEVLDVRNWEESILFACERVSYADAACVGAVAAVVLEAMAIDPMLAAEMIYRSAPAVWNEVQEKILDFVGRWHADGTVDRAVHFMISTGRGEFASRLWPLISHADDHVRFAALRAGRRFRPSVLGVDVERRITELSEAVRRHVLSEIASESGMDGIELATRMARADASPGVRAGVIEALHFRRADRFVADILRTAPDQVWQLLARNGSIEEIADPAMAARLRIERQRFLESVTDPLEKLGLLLRLERSDAIGAEVGPLVEAVEFPATDPGKGWLLHEAHRRFPDEVVQALVRRVEAGRGVPYQAEDVLRGADLAIDEGPLVDLVSRPDGLERVPEAAASIMGPQIVGRIIDQLAAMDRQLRGSREPLDKAAVEQFYRLKTFLSKTGLRAFAQALLSRSAIEDPPEIALFAELVAHHGRADHEAPLRFEESLYEPMIALVGRWAETLLVSPTASRAHLAEAACAIERLAAPQLLPALRRLLAEDLTRWRRARQEFFAARARGLAAPVPADVSSSWTLQYRGAFAAIGTPEVVELMTEYLRDTEFGVDAAYVLQAIWDRKHRPPERKPFGPWAEFSEVRARRSERQKRGGSEGSPFADAILAVVDELATPDAGEKAQRHALQLARVAFTMPYDNKAETIETLLGLPRPLHEKRPLLAILVLAGEIIRSDVVLEGLKALLERAKTERWLLDQNQGALEGWIELMPFSDRPGATLEALEMVDPDLRPPSRLRRLLLALGYAPSQEAENVLARLAREDVRLLGEHDWLTALGKRGTESAARILLDLICEHTSAGIPKGIDGWVLSSQLADAMRVHTNFRADVYRRYESLPANQAKAILDSAIAEVADSNGVLVLVRAHALQGRSFSGILHTAIRHAVVGQRPSTYWKGADETFSVPVPDLRKELFAMTWQHGAEARIAIACLNAIDEIRGDYGPPEAEPRHPDIECGRPWPLAVETL